MPCRIRFQESVERDGVGLGSVDPTGGEVLIDLVLGLVLLDLGGLGEVLLGVGRVRRRHLHADYLAFHTRGCSTELLVLRPDDRSGCVVVLVGEVDRLHSLGGDRHGVDYRIDLFRGQRGDEPVPRDRRQRTGELRLVADRIEDLDLPAIPIAAGVLLVNGG